MLRLAHDRELRQVVPAADDVGDCRAALRSKSEQGLERSHRCPATVMAKNELVQIDLQLIATDAMVRSDEPLLKITDGTIGERHHGLGTLSEILSRRLHSRDMPIPGIIQAGKLLQTIAVDRRTRRDVLPDKCQQRCRLKVGDYGHPCASRPGSTLLDGYSNKNCFSPFQLATATQPWLWTSHPRVVQFNLAVQGFPRYVDHGSPELMQEQPSGFVPADRQLSLKQQRRNPTLVGGHQIGGPKPQGQRRLRSVENRARCQRHLVVALCTFPAVPCLQWVCPRVPATRTSEPIWPPTRLEILPARRFVAEMALKLVQIGREHGTGHSGTLLIVVT